MSYRHSIALMLLGIIPAMASSQPTDSTSVGGISYVRVVPYSQAGKPLSPVSDADFYRMAGSITFPVNKWTIDPATPLLSEIDSILIPLARANQWQLMAISMRGAASPEGSLQRNRLLGEKRGQAVFDYLAQRLDIRGARYRSVDNVAEDYVGLCLLLEEDGDKDAALVRKIVEECGGNLSATKLRLQREDGGRLWSKLLSDVFPRLRAARLILYFNTPKPAAEILSKSVTLDIRKSDTTLPIGIKPDLTLPDIPPLAIEPPGEPLRRHVLAVRTNLLYDAFFMPDYGWAPMPDVQLEFYPRRGHLTYSIGFTCPYWHKWESNKFFQIRNYNLELRYYIRPGLYHTRGYVGAYAHGAKYGIGLSKTRGWQGEGGGGGLTAGYVFPISRTGRWRMEVSVGAGVFVTRHDPYVYGNPITGEEDGNYYYDYNGSSIDFKKRNHRFIWLGPTQAGLSLTCDLLYWRQQQRGVGFKRKEAAR